MGKLTLNQLLVLSDFDRAFSPRMAGSDLAAVRRLAALGMLDHRAGSGKFSTWTITDAGRRALSEGDQ